MNINMDRVLKMNLKIIVLAVTAFQSKAWNMPSTNLNRTKIMSSAGPIVKNFGKQSLQLFEKMPVVAGSKEFPPDDWNKYILYLLGGASFCFIPAVICCLWGFIYWMMTGPCASCCYKEKEDDDFSGDEFGEDDYNLEGNENENGDTESKKKKEDKGPSCAFCVFVLLVLTAGMVSFTVVGYIANGHFSEAIVGRDEGILRIIDDLLLDTDGFANSTMVPLKRIQTQTTHLVHSEVIPLLNQTGVVEFGVFGITTKLENFMNMYNNKQVIAIIGSESYVFDCAFCSTVAAEVGTIKDQIAANTEPTFEDLRNVRMSMEVDLVERETDIVSATDDVYNKLKDGRGKVKDIQGSYDEVEPAIIEINAYREIGFCFVFAIPLLPFFLVVIGAIWKKTYFFTLMTVIVWTSMIFLLLLAGVHMIVSAVLFSSCGYIDTINNNMTNLITGSAGTLLQSCIDDTLIAEAFNLTSQLQFADSISFPDLPDVSESFDITELDSFFSDTNSVDTSTFNALGDQALQSVNDLTANCIVVGVPGCTPDTFTRTNISALVETDYYASGTSMWTSLVTAKTSAIDIITAESATMTAFQQVVDDMQADMGAIIDDWKVLKNDTNDIQDKFENSESLLDPLLATATEMTQNTRCGFVGYHYRSMDAQLCDELLPALAAMMVTMIVITILSCPVVICSIKTKAILKAQRKKKGTDTDDDEHVNLIGSDAPQSEPNATDNGKGLVNGNASLLGPMV